MSDGGGESSSKEYKARETGREIVGGDKFACAIAKIAVAQVCDGAGFHGFHELALDTLSGVAVRYIFQIGKAGSFYANLSGRSESNVFDVVQGLEDLGLARGFLDASDTGHCFAGSGVVREVSRYVSEEDENPFAYAIPKFPVISNRKSVQSFAQVGDAPPSEHIPTWLPLFPEPQTYSQERQVDNTTNNIEPFREWRDVDRSVMNNLHQHMPCNGSEAPIAIDGVDVVKANQSVGNNPFLAPPLRFGEKEVSSIVIPPKLLDGTAMREIENDVPVFEVFSAVSEPIKSPLNNIEEAKEMVFPSTRPTMRFKLKSFKKSPGTCHSVKIDDSEQINSLLEVKNDKTERKRRAEQILKESMDIVEESAEL